MNQNQPYEKLEQKIKSLEKEFSECKHALKTSRENEERLELILKSTNDGIWDWDAKEDKAYSSIRYKELIGFAEEDDNFPVTWNEWASLIHPDDYDYVMRDFWKYLKEKRSYDIEYRYRHTNGEYRWHSSKGIALFDEAGNVQRIVGSTWDINDRKLAEEEMRKSEEKWRSFVKLTSDWIWEMNEQGAFTYLDANIKKFIGYGAEEVIGKKMSYLMTDELGKRAQHFLDKYNKLKKPFPMIELTHIHKDGREVICETSGVPVFDGEDNLTGWRGLNKDISERVRMVKALQESEERFRSIVELTSDWVWEIDQNGIFTFGSHDIKDVLGYELEEVIGKPIQFFMPAEDAERTNEFFFEKTKQQVLFKRFEHMSMHKNGQHLMIETSGVPIFNADKKLVGWRGVDSDVTKRVLMEQELRKSEAKFRSLVETSSDWIFEVDLNGVFIYVDPKVINFLGYDSTEIVGRLFAHFVSRDEAKRIFRYFSARGLPKPFRMLKITYLHKDGRSVVFETSGTVIFDETGKAIGWRGMHHDITEQVNADKELRVSNAKFLAAFHSNPCAMIMSSLEDGRIIELNESVLRVSGYDRKDFMGDDAHGNLWADVKQRDHFVQILKKDGMVRDFEMDFIKDRGRATGIANISAINISLEGKPHLLGILIDVTDQKRSEEELRKYKDQLEDLVKQRTVQLEAANNELEAFAYSVSHDLRAPLRAIDGFSLALLEDYEEKLDDEGKEYLNRVRASSQRMGLLIDDILKLSRLTRSDMRYENVDLSAIALTITKELQAGDPDRDVEVDITPDLIERGDYPLLRVALENLISNAWKFTAGQGHAQIKLGAEAIGEETAYFVSDNGAGFDMAYADKLFGAFQRLHSAKDFPGSGIGLATTQRAIHRHGGRVWAKGAVNEGATFYFTL